MKVLTLSTYYGRGGAGSIAKALHDRLLSDGQESIFLYAFDKKGLPGVKTKNVRPLAYPIPFIPHFNYLAHKIIGKDIFSAKNKNLEELLRWADIVHLHIIHSHGFNYEQLLGLLQKLEKRVVITVHDSWYYTGRCAIRGQCEEWRDGCPKCPHLDYYPNAMIDIAKTEHKNKTNLIRGLKHLTFASPSDWIAHDLKYTYPKKKIEVIRNGINITHFKSESINTDRSNAVMPRIVFINGDFNQKEKVDYEFLEKLIKLPLEIHFIGSNFPYEGENIVNHGFVKDKHKLATILASSDMMLFFSRIDNFPTVLIEALCAGTHIVSYESKGAKEVLYSFNPGQDYSIIKKFDEFVDIIENKKLIQKIRHNKPMLSERAKEYYSFDNMYQLYCKLYQNSF